MSTRAPGGGTAVEHCFLLSPAFLGGKRGALLRSGEAAFPLAERLRSPGGAPIGEVYAFVSGLYFRGKLTYARAHAPSPRHSLVITPTRGLVQPDQPIHVAYLEEFARVDIAAGDAQFRAPLERDARELARSLPGAGFVLLGSIATGKYADILTEVLGDRLLFPREFIGRGDMSRGGLLLRAAEAGTQLDYVPVLGPERRGSRPTRLPPR